MAEKKVLPLHQAVAVGVAPRLRVGLRALVGYLLVALAALIPRALDLGRFITDDEANFWLHRSDVFLNAVRSGDFIATAITTHPGVTTMWLGAGGIVARRALTGWGLLHSEAFPVILAFMRLPVVLVHVAAITAGYGLLRRMLPPRRFPALALLAALLWAADPFVVGYSRLLHTDALAMSFATLSLLAASWFWNHRAGRRWLVLSGIAAGLAFLSKSPALVLLPAVGLVALLAAFDMDDRRATSDDRPSLQPPASSLQPPASNQAHSPFVRLWSFVLPLGIWAALATLTVFVLWPALWVSPLAAYRQVQIGVTVEGAQPHMLGNFFLGRQDDAPGLLYYLLALPLRLTPWTLFGLLALPLAWWQMRRAARDGRAQGRDLLALVAFVALFIAAMSVFPKKFDRYLVPAFPSLDILAAFGLYGIGDWGLGIRHRLRRESPISILSPPIKGVWPAGIVLAALLNVAWWQPYQIVAFNQLFGGTPTGARTFFMGWGEGLEQVAAWLNAQPDITSVRTIALRVTSLNPYLKDGAQADFPKGDQLRDRTGYVVVYLPQTQAGPPDAPFDRFYGRAAPLHVVRIHGVDFAWIYQAPPAVAQERPAGFGPNIRLYGFDAGGAWQRGQAMSLRLIWQATAPPPADYWLFAHLVGPDGRRHAQLDLPYPTGGWAPGRFTATDLPITLPADAPPGTYRLQIGLYLPGGERLALTADDPRDRAPDSADTLVLTTFEVR
jgi:hypothetical protein